MQQLLWGVALILNLATLITFGLDKFQSRRKGARRVPERTLLWMMFLGGLIGGWVAMSLFRHKTVKRSFRIWAIVLTLLSPFWLLVWWWLVTQGAV
ncbi:MAG: DUF1294 domain-containing protein [Planctomycetes bacterium]|nr:DUF1294 domain-containing protein [Planctomycetota bacterium]